MTIDTDKKLINNDVYVITTDDIYTVELDDVYYDDDENEPYTSELVYYLKLLKTLLINL